MFRASVAAVRLAGSVALNDPTHINIRIYNIDSFHDSFTIAANAEMAYDLTIRLYTGSKPACKRLIAVS